MGYMLLIRNFIAMRTHQIILILTTNVNDTNENKHYAPNVQSLCYDSHSSITFFS